MTAPKEVVDLVERFEKHEPEYKRSEYSEEDTKDEFITPLFEALGWDVHNKQGNSPNQKEVRFERQLRLPGGKIQHPDYTFYIDGNQRFLVEAKKPFKNLSADRTLIDQVRKYGYRAGFFLSIITDFEELVIYDTRFKPHQNDDYLFYRLKYYKYTEYVEKWDEISSILSKNAVENHEHLDILPEYELQNASTDNNKEVKEDIEKDIEEDINEDVKDKDKNVNDLTNIKQILIHLIKEKIEKDKNVLSDEKELHHHHGIRLPKNKVFLIDEEEKDFLIKKYKKNSEIIVPVITADDIINGNIIPEGYLINAKKGIDIKKDYPSIYNNHFQKPGNVLTKNGKVILNFTFPEYLDKPKIIYASLKNNFEVFFDYEGKYPSVGHTWFYHDKNFEVDESYLKILNSILSSNVMKFYLKEVAPFYSKSKTLREFNKVIENTPIIDINKNDPNIERLEKITDDLIKENKNLEKLEKDIKDTTDEKEIENIKSQEESIELSIQKLKNQLNDIVYELYDLTLEKEIIEWLLSLNS